MIQQGSKQQRDVSNRTKKLKNDVKKLLLEYEKEVGLEVTLLKCRQDNSFGITTYEVSVEVALPTFKDDDE